MSKAAEAAGPPHPPPSAKPEEQPVFWGANLRTVSFGVTLHILHGCQCVKAPHDPVAERRGAPLNVPRPRHPKGQVPTARQEAGLRLGPGCGPRKAPHRVRGQRTQTDGRQKDRRTGQDSGPGAEGPKAILASCLALSTVLWEHSAPTAPTLSLALQAEECNRDHEATKLEIPPGPSQEKSADPWTRG